MSNNFYVNGNYEIHEEGLLQGFVLCLICGVDVGSIKIHDEWHKNIVEAQRQQLETQQLADYNRILG